MSTLAYNPADFLHSLCVWIAAQTGLQYAGRPRQLWRNLLVEQDAAPVASVLTVYPGPALEYFPRLPQASVQVRTAGADADAASIQAQTIFESFTDKDGLPVRGVGFPGFRASDNGADGMWRVVFAKPLQRPGKIGLDERGRSLFTFNVDLGFLKGS